MISNNDQLCYEDTIEWQDIIAEGAEVHFHDNRNTEEWEDRHRDDNVRECKSFFILKSNGRRSQMTSNTEI